MAEMVAYYRDLPLDRMAALAPALWTEGNGSNSWVVAGERTATGKPLLANDPHLGLTAPAIWYFAHLNAPGLNVIGATLPGVPAIVLGRNDDIAWGFSNTGSDVQDLFIERYSDGDRASYDTPVGPREFTVRTEVIEIAGEKAVEIEVRASPPRTHHLGRVSPRRRGGDRGPRLGVRLDGASRGRPDPSGGSQNRDRA